MPFAKCARHGRVFDSAKEEGCPLCIQEASMPRAPGGTAAPKTTNADEAAAKGKQFLLAVLGVIVLAVAGIYWYKSTHRPEDAAMAARDSLRALAAGPPRADTTKFVDPSDLSPIRRSRALRGTLGAMLDNNRATLMGFPEGPVDTTVTDRAAKRRALAYVNFAKRWHERLDAATREGSDFRYAPGTRMGPQMESVTNYLGAALSVMRDMVPPDRVKPRAERQADAAAVGGYLNSAGSVLTNLPR